jgi:signal transduction histidine kinase
MKRWWDRRVVLGGVPMTTRDRVRIERVVAASRLFIAAVSLLTLRFGAVDPGTSLPLAYLVRAGYVVLAAALAVLIRTLPDAAIRWAYRIHVVDVLWAAAITYSAAVGDGDFSFIFFAFVLFAAAARWGPAETLATGVAAVAVLLIGADLTSRFGSFIPDVRRLLVQAGYLLVLTALLGFVVWKGQAFRAARNMLSRVVLGLAATTGVTDGLRLLVAECIDYFNASAAILVMRDVRSERTYTWRGSRAAERREIALALREPCPGADHLAFSLPDGMIAWHIRRPRSGPVRGRGVGEDETTPVTEFDADGAADLLRVEHTDAALGADMRDPTGQWWGRLVLIDVSQISADDLHVLAALVVHARPALYSDYLLQRSRSRIEEAERARVARELHDGVIQSLIGLEMEVEVLRRDAQVRGVGDSVSALTEVRDRLREQVAEVRALMWQLRPIADAGRNLPRAIAETVERFRRQAPSIDVTLDCDSAEVSVSPRAGRELTRIVQEALVNVRRHSGAQRATVKLGADATTSHLIIEDAGRGFGFDGVLSLDELEARRLGPLVIMERVRAMRATLTIESRPGRGTRLDVSWPRRSDG